MKVLRLAAIGVLATIGPVRPARAEALPVEQRPPSPVTFAKDIAPLVFTHCATCHRPGGSAPFSLLTYGDVRTRARQITAAVSSRSMPPWKPEPGYGDFQGSRRLSDEQVETFKRWMEQGSVEGDTATAPPAPDWPDTWQLGPPDLVLKTSGTFMLPPHGPDRMRNFVIPVPVGARRYVRAWEFRTNAPQAVHHATLVLDRSGESRRLDERDPEPGYEGLIPLAAQNPDGYFLGWTPGQTPSIAPDRMAWRLDPGTDLVMMLHLRPGDEARAVDASIGLYFTDSVPTEVPAMIRLNQQDIDIPPGDSRYAIHDTYRLPVDVDVYSVQPHAHNLARRVRASAILPDGTTRPLIYIPDWDFHWQDVYRYRTPLFLPAGTRLEMEFVYDNSSGNRSNPSYPPKRVTYGQQTTDEMGDLWVQAVPRRHQDLPVLAESLRRKLLPQNIEGYRMMLQKEPDNVGLHDDLALLLLQAGDVAAAAREFRESLRLSPDRAAAHYNVGNASFLLGQYADAERHFEQSLQRNPEYGLARQGLALALEAQGRLDEAADAFAAALKVMPTAEVHYNFGVLRQRQGQLDSARAEYDEALRLAPGNPDASFGLGLVQAATGRDAAAVQSFRAALANRPGWNLAAIELAWILATAPDDQVRRPEEALALAKNAVSDDAASDAHALDVLAAAMAAAGRYADAAATAQRALAALPPTGANALREALQARRRLYAVGRSYRASAPLR